MEDNSKKLNIICERRLEKYKNLSETALKEIKKNIFKGKEKEAGKIIEMVECYLSDARHFEKQGHFVNAFGALNYAHGWIDCGVRLKIFNVTDDKLFTLP